MRYTVLSFDLDGTLVDTADEIAEAVNRTLSEAGLPRQDPAQIAQFIGAGTRETLLRTLAYLQQGGEVAVDARDTEALLARLQVHGAQTAGTLARPYPGCEAMLAALRDSGVRLACLTNKEHRFARRVLQATRLERHFDHVVGGDLTPYRKPQPESLLHVIRVLGGETHRAAHIGDSQVDVQTAHAAGVEAWAVPWGYNGGVPVVRSAPQRVFASLAAIADHVLAANGVDTLAGPLAA